MPRLGSRRTSPDFHELPEPVRLDETIASHEAPAAPDPAMGRDPETEWLLRNASG